MYIFFYSINGLMCSYIKIHPNGVMVISEHQFIKIAFSYISLKKK